MNKLKTVTLIVFSLLVIVLVSFRISYLMDEPIRTTEFAVNGMESGMGIEAGSTIDGIVIAVPDVLEMEDVISVSSSPEVAYLRLAEDNADDRVYTCEIVALSAGIAELYVRSADGETVSEKYLVNVFPGDDADTPAAEISNELVDEAKPGEVYVTPKGSKYHLSRKCAGQSASVVTLEDAVDAGYEPCKNCAVKE